MECFFGHDNGVWYDVVSSPEKKPTGNETEQTLIVCESLFFFLVPYSSTRRYTLKFSVSLYPSQPRLGWGVGSDSRLETAGD